MNKSTFQTLISTGRWCNECATNANIIAAWLSEPNEPVTVDVVVGLACAFAIEHHISIHECLQTGAQTAKEWKQITPLP